MVCGGCQYTQITLEDELKLKKTHLRGLLTGLLKDLRPDSDGPLGASRSLGEQGSLPEIQICQVSNNTNNPFDGHGFRVRSDLSFTQNNGAGFYQQAPRGHDIFRLNNCQHWEPELKRGLKKIHLAKLPFEKASLRLRVSPSGDLGLWLDISHVDTKSLLENRSLVETLLENFNHVEVGQRHKKLVITDRPRLGEPELKSWFQTSFENKALNLFCHIGNFTQPSLKYNFMITQALEECLEIAEATCLFEFGSGIGNLSFPLLSYLKKSDTKKPANSKNSIRQPGELICFENDTSALAGFQKSLSQINEVDRARVKVISGNFQSIKSSAGPNQTPTVNSKIDQATYSLLQRADFALCNPPRSGLKDFTHLIQALETKNVVYMSCFPESMVMDLKVIMKHNYMFSKIFLINQFPRSKHYEVMILLQRVKS